MNEIVIPENLNIAGARLPVAYEAVKVALANCVRIDECKDWANKAEALASYAKQADDDTLLKQATRIHARAVRRCGELLKEFDAKGRNQHTAAADSTLSQREAAEAAGMSERQQVTAVRVANVAADIFDAAVDSDKPPTITKLAETGTKTRAPPPGFKQATQLIGTIKRYAEFCDENDPLDVAQGVLREEIAAVREHIATIDAWHDVFITNLEG